MKLVGVYSAPDRDPRGRVVSVAFACEVPPGTEATAGDDAAAAVWWKPDLLNLKNLAFDHARILQNARAAQAI